jgi:EmrB/QacA subfamily drug resistance transporter
VGTGPADAPELGLHSSLDREHFYASLDQALDDIELPAGGDRPAHDEGPTMTTTPDDDAKDQGAGNPRLALLLAMAMFVLVVDTSLMNVSISAVITDLDTTASGVQSAIALEALISAAFILINSKMGDLMGRKRAYVIGLCAYAVGALAMTLAQSLTAVIIFWAIVGGLGASLLLPAMQSLIHGNFEGAAQKKAYALVGASAAIAAAVGPLIGGFVTTYLSWRVGFGLEVVVIAVILSQIRLVEDVPYTGLRQVDLVGAFLSVIGMGGVVLGILVWQEGGEFVGLLMAIGAVALAALAYWLVRRKRQGRPTLLDPDLFRHLNFRIGISQQMLQNVTLGGAMIALPLFLQMTLEYNAMQTGLSLAPLSLSMFGMAMLAGRKAGKRRPARIVLAGFGLATVGMAAIIPLVPRIDSGWYLVVPLLVTGSGLGLLVSQLNNFTLAPISEDRISEAAGVNSASGSFGLSFGLAMAGGIMLWALALGFTNMTEASTVIPPAQQEQIATEMNTDAEVMSNTQLQQQIADQPQDVQDAVLTINTDARNLSLQVALLVPAVAALLGLVNSLRMMRLPDITPAAPIEGVDLG